MAFVCASAPLNAGFRGRLREAEEPVTATVGGGDRGGGKVCCRWPTFIHLPVKPGAHVWLGD